MTAITMTAITMNLKSSLDRFIVKTYEAQEVNLKNLKSSLDRFIELLKLSTSLNDNNLKSSLDRFIVAAQMLPLILITI